MEKTNNATPRRQTIAIALAGRFLERSNAFIQDALEDEALYPGIVPAHGDLFKVLFAEPEGISVSELARRTHRTKSTVSILTEKLMHRGWLEKCPSAADGRVVVLRLTDEGRALEPVLERISAALCERVTANLTEDETAHLELLLRKAIRGFEMPE